MRRGTRKRKDFSHYDFRFWMTALRLSQLIQGPAQQSGPSSGPHPSFIQVAKPFIFERTIQECFAATGTDPLREDSNRLQGVTWIDNVRKALQLYELFFKTLYRGVFRC